MCSLLILPQIEERNEGLSVQLPRTPLHRLHLSLGTPNKQTGFEDPLLVITAQMNAENKQKGTKLRNFQ